MKNNFTTPSDSFQAKRRGLQPGPFGAPCRWGGIFFYPTMGKKIARGG